MRARSEKVQSFNKIIFRYFAREGRKMPWRNTRDPYRILVSEMMLQQTQVDRVRDKYGEFLKKFPDIRALAKAPLGDVLHVWSGLGYNRRAKYLWLAGQEILSTHAGVFPRTMTELVLLPGIGRSTAAGIMAFAFGKEEPMIDTNVRRVLTRVFFKHTSMTDAALYDFAKILIPKGRGREWNYALLDVAAAKCTARNHAADCVLKKLHGRTADVVKKHPQKPFKFSDRYYRGRILEQLRQHRVGLNTTLLRRMVLSDASLLNQLLKKLVREGLLEKRRTVYRLP